jgi:hypothetical protein
MGSAVQRMEFDPKTLIDLEYFVVNEWRCAASRD